MTYCCEDMDNAITYHLINQYLGDNRYYLYSDLFEAKVFINLCPWCGKHLPQLKVEGRGSK